MGKEKILEYLKNNNINYLKLGNVSFSKSENLLCLTFLYEEKNYDKIQQEKENIINQVKNYVNIDKIEYLIKFNKAFLDDERLKILIKDFMKVNHRLSFFSLKNIDVFFINNTFNVTLNTSLTEEENKKIIQELLKFLEDKYFYNFKIDFKNVDNSYNLLQEHKSEILDNISDPIKINKMKVNKIENIIGEILENTCYPYEYYKSAEENIYLCGHLESIEEIEFTKKDGETKGIRYALKVKCLDKLFNATIFPTKKNLEIVKNIENNIDIIMNGSLDNFNNFLTFKVKSLAKCVIEDFVKPEISINKVYDKYKFVTPTKYEEITQLNLFENKISKDYLMNNEFVVFDLETTGLDYMTEKVTEIGAVKIKNGVITEVFSTFINPEKDIDFEITKLTGITNEMVKNAPKLENVIPDFYKFCNGAILVAQNIQFDFGFIDYYSRQINYVFDHEKNDTMILAKKNMFLKNYKLKTIAESLNVPLINAHRAINDALATAKVFIKLVEKYY
ncbi:MAG: hypothetical protein E7359_00960 [Clostridiales bacterium]|nr:hypothetical protein [Clostridiales bacterium]